MTDTDFEARVADMLLTRAGDIASGNVIILNQGRDVR